MSEAGIEIYHFEQCPYCEKARRTFRILGMDYESHMIDPRDRSEVREVSGQPEVPVIVDGENVVYDSDAIIEYLDNHYGAEIDIIPVSPAERGEARILSKFADDTWGDLNYRAQLELDAEGTDLNDASRKVLQEAINRQASLLNDFFTNRTFAVGETVTLADIALSSFLSRIIEFSEFEIPEEFAHLWDWYSRVGDHLKEPVAQA
ncbi:MAG TPA: glutathione S-transferase family protein [bacterium]|nr:glutathione S-transferase family protein [bacterium]